MKYSNFGEFISAKRHSLNHKRIYIANKLELSATYVRDMEMGNRPAPNSELLLRLLANLNIDKDTDEYFEALDLAAETREDIPLDIKDFIRANSETFYPLFRKMAAGENCSNEISELMNLHQEL